MVTAQALTISNHSWVSIVWVRMEKQSTHHNGLPIISSKGGLGELDREWDCEGSGSIQQSVFNEGRNPSKTSRTNPCAGFFRLFCSACHNSIAAVEMTGATAPLKVNSCNCTRSAMIKWLQYLLHPLGSLSASLLIHPHCTFPEDFKHHLR